MWAVQLRLDCAILRLCHILALSGSLAFLFVTEQYYPCCWVAQEAPIGLQGLLQSYETYLPLATWNLDCQLDRINNHLGDKSLGVSVSTFPGRSEEDRLFPIVGGTIQHLVRM